MKKEQMEEQRKKIVDQIEELKKKESELAKDLELTRANMNANLGALQYHDFIVTQLTPNTPELPVTEAEVITE